MNTLARYIIDIRKEACLCGYIVKNKLTTDFISVVDTLKRNVRVTMDKLIKYWLPIKEHRCFIRKQQSEGNTIAVVKEFLEHNMVRSIARKYLQDPLQDVNKGPLYTC